MNNSEKEKIQEIKEMNQEHFNFNGQLMEDCAVCSSIIEAKKKKLNKYPLIKRYENLEHLEHFNEDGSKK